MANPKARRPQNASGNFYVDSSCINCGTCQWLAPLTFMELEGQSAVIAQPVEEREYQAALNALLACPVSAIGATMTPEALLATQARFPLQIAENVFYCGYHSDLSFGGTSYFIQRPEGNILIDSPRFAMPLVKRLEALGGVRYLYITHRNAIADHQAFRDYFGCYRLLHRADMASSSTAHIELPLEGNAPIRFAADIQILPVPGHTAGHTVLLYRDRFLFSGKHLLWSPWMNQLYALRRQCGYSWSKQIESMQRLGNHTFEWVLPGHGYRYHTIAAKMKQNLQVCLDWMKTQTGRSRLNKKP